MIAAPRSPRTVVQTALALAIVVPLVVACSGTTASPSASASVAPSSSAPPSAAASASPSESAAASEPTAETELEMVAQDFTFVLPSPTTPAGVTALSLENTGKEEHQAQAAKIADGKTIEDVKTALLADETAAFALLTFSGGPTGVAPGATVSVDVELTPGNYVFLCFVPSPDGIPHIAKGMVAGLEVTEGTTSGELPEGDGETTLKDFEFAMPTGLAAGEHTITVTNDGPQPHEATVVKLNDGVTIDQVKAAFASAASAGPPPWTSAGGIAAISAGTEATMDLDLESGEYAFICFVPDPATGQPHAALGMVAGLTIP